MATELKSGWQPDWGVAPGEILLEALQDRGMTQSELANRTARPLKTINEIVKGKAAITAETAIQLERALGISAGFWTGLETAYRGHIARRNAQMELEASADWLKGFPVKDLTRHNVIETKSTKSETVAELLSFFRVSSPDAFERHWLAPSAAFRSSPAFEAAPKAVAAWLRWGEIEAGKIECGPFSASRFRKILTEIRPLTRRSLFMQALGKVRAMCAEVGVAVIATPELEGTHLSGATRWIGPHKAVIQLSLRHKTTDNVWFSFFHESRHVLASARRHDYLDADEDISSVKSDEEEEANRFARDILLPSNSYRAFVAKADFTRSSVRAFAKEQQVAPGIVVGRLQRESLVKPSQLNDLKDPIRWA